MTEYKVGVELTSSDYWTHPNNVEQLITDRL